MLPRFFQSSNENPPAPRRLSALMLAVVYTVIACLWIVLSDRLLLTWVTDREQYVILTTYKGWAFVIFSALMLYFERAWNEQESERVDQALQQRVDERTMALELSRAQLQVIMDHAPVIFYMRDLEGHYIWVNEQWTRQTGCSFDDAIGATPSQLFAPEMATEILHNQRAVLARNAALINETTLTLQGEPRIFMRAVFPLTTAEGEPYAVAGILTDVTEQRQIERSLREAEARYRTLFDVAATGIAITDATGCYVDANPAFAKMLGYDVPTLKRMTCWDVTAPQDASEDRLLFTQMVAGETHHYVLEKQYQRADGTIFWGRLTESVLQRDQEDGLYLAVIEDITARREVEAARQQMQEQLAAQVAARTGELRHVNAELAEAQRIAHVGSWSFDLSTEEMIGSAETYRILGIAADTETRSGETLRTLVHPDDLERLAAAAQAAMTQRRPLDEEHRILRPDGTPRIVQLRGDVRYGDDGTPVRVIGSIQDITVQKETELALREANERLSALIDASPLAILVVRVDGVITLWNAAAETVYGYTAAEVLGQPVTVLKAPEHVALHEQRRAMKDGESFDDLETQRTRADGRVIDVSVSTAPIFDEHGRVASVVGVVADITERKEAEKQLRLLNHELENRVAERTQHLEQEIAERVRVEAEVLALNRALAEQAANLEAINKELETFTYSVSHDLKAPLRGLDGYSRLLQEDYQDQLDEEGQFFVQSIRHAAGQMAQLIDDLLAYSRMERRQLHAAPIHLPDLLATLISQIRHEQPDTPIDIAQRLEVTDVHADPGALTFALRNLIENAIKFSVQSQTPTVEIGSRATEHGWLLYVQDNGIGFDMQYSERIFEIFQRLHRAEEYPGTGIGLAIVRKAVQRLQGRVWAESQPGAGATFYMEFEHEPIMQVNPTY